MKNLTLKTKLSSDELDQVIKLDKAKMKYFWSKKEWHNLDEQKHHIFSLFDNKDQLQSFCLTQSYEFDDVVHLLKIASHTSRVGFASHLIEEIKSRGRSNAKKSIYLEVEVGNTKAVAFYEKHGFELLRTNKSFYSDGSDAYIMHCLL